MLFRSQNCPTTAVTVLAEKVKESSGLIFFDGKLVTHNDSGDGPNLYEIDTLTGAVLRTVTISNATNKDWEDITHDEENIYIGDFGNNYGNRTDLVIYKISKADFNTKTSIVADKIAFNYAHQKKLTSQLYANNFDCEAMLSLEDSLLLFSKNWQNKKTYSYILPKTPGAYTIAIRDSFDTQGLVTGATYNPYTKSVLLIGYITTSLGNYLWEFSAFEGTNVFRGKNDKCTLNIIGSPQVEAITMKNSTTYYFSSEELSRKGITLKPYLSTFEHSSYFLSKQKKFTFEILPPFIDRYFGYFFRNFSSSLKDK